MKTIKLTYSLMILTSLALVSCGGKKTETKPVLDANIIPVKTASVSAFSLPDTVAATGVVTTENEAQYAFKIGGVINHIYIEEGKFFHKGQLLATLNATEIDAGVSQASLNVEKAERDYKRAANLYRDSVYTLEQLQNTKTALDVAKQSKSAVAFNQAYSRIYAASDGFVAQKIGTEGEVVSPGSPVLAINEANGGNNYLLRVGVTDKEWASINTGQKASISLDGYPDKKLEGFVFRKSQASDKAAGSFQVELKLALDKIRPAVGMFGKAVIDTKKEDAVVVVPYDALVEIDGNKAFVFVPKGKTSVKRVPVTISGFDSNKAYIKTGLKASDSVVITNSAFLNEQSIVTINR